jgi:histidine ammonia-lyase
MFNPTRNKYHLPTYLIGPAGKPGLQSGFMITQYTANALTHKICLLAHPSGTMNLTSANESEDIVSYGATACQRLLEQLGLMKELLSIYLVAVGQGYALARPEISRKNKLAETAFSILQSRFAFPHSEDAGFEERYKTAAEILDSGALTELVSAWPSNHDPYRGAHVAFKQ